MTSAFEDHSHPAIIQVPSGEANGSRVEIPCTFESMEGKRLKVLAGARLAISAAVSVQYEDAMFLGEVMVCRKESADAWHIEIGVEQILTGLQSLMALRAGLLGDAAAVPRGFVPVAAQN